MGLIDAARRISIAKSLSHLNSAFAMDQAEVAISHGGADANEVALVVGAFLKATTEASANLVSGLQAIMPNAVTQATSTRDIDV